ncbi:efflux RND transporter periplasmic adaptor subunit [Propionivibrio dicarboxylicus]|uniref:RND family efflux transporter, MFP subunit n=1 Tax=Propionivibrio dicarboxylicus TaxID=83767 RepID=A0A1G8IY47_9RHOO|nr:efflux RND transporter periplasmic adaptor subunit [Propionivibrio dicarboxylicus]SDI23360.1 RND family efflux transporter, MFP subunit [Propionivibrio dicarboxylicus]
MTEQRHSELDLHPIDTGSDEDHANLVKRQQVMRYTQRAGIVLLVVLALGAGRTVFSRVANAQVLEKRTAEQSKIYLRATQARMGGAERVLTLPATLQGYVQSPVAARAAGYVKRWTKDIGSRVEKGELLAEIAAPEIDQQLSQAIAARDQAAANLALARSTAERWEGLRRKDVVSQQDLEEKRSAAAQSQANLAAAEANMQRLRQLEEFKRVVAPFAGVITRRNVDVGDLIDSSRVLFALSQTDPLRVYVSVPQAYAHLVKTGLKVSVTQSELAGQRFTGKIARTAASIDTATRTMQVEVSLPNPDGLLLPGAYVQVGLPLADNRALTAPTNTLLIRGEGTLVASVDDKGVVSLRRVTIGRNYGADFEVLDGISAKDRLILNPPDWLADGQVVTLVADKEQP